MAISKLQDARIHSDESGALDVDQIRSRTRQMIQKTGPLALIAVDYIQLISGIRRRNIDNRADELTEFLRG